MKCEIRWCKSGKRATTTTNENIGDGCWRVWICEECAKALGVGPNTDLPEPLIVKEKLEKFYFLKEGERNE